MTWVQAGKQKVVNRLYQWLRAAYYLVALERRFPFKKNIERAVHRWESEQGKGDVPKPRDAWEAQYRTSDWSYLQKLDESSHYAVITGYIAYLKAGGAVLDVGCGEGILFQRFRPYGYAKYVGLDISEAAIAKLLPLQDERTAFLQADAEAYQPAEPFDAIVFSESLYYFQDPLTAVARYAKAVKPDGVLIVSTYMSSRRAAAILRQIKKHYEVVDETGINQGTKSWVCTVLRAGPAAS